MTVYKTTADLHKSTTVYSILCLWGISIYNELWDIKKYLKGSNILCTYGYDTIKYNSNTNPRSVIKALQPTRVRVQ